MKIDQAHDEKTDLERKLKVQQGIGKKYDNLKTKHDGMVESFTMLKSRYQMLIDQMRIHSESNF